MYLSDKDVALRYGVTPNTIWRWSRTDPDFPKPVQLTPGCTRWMLADLEAWEASKRPVAPVVARPWEIGRGARA